MLEQEDSKKQEEKQINKILILNIGYIIGILIGLYSKSIAFFICIFLVIYTILTINKKTKKYIKLIFPKVLMIISIITILISSNIIKYKEKDYSEKYKDITQISAKAIIESNIQEKEYNNQCTIKIIECAQNKQLENTKLLAKIPKNMNVKFYDVITIKGEYIRSKWI